MRGGGWWGGWTNRRLRWGGGGGAGPGGGGVGGGGGGKEGNFAGAVWAAQRGVGFSAGGVDVRLGRADAARREGELCVHAAGISAERLCVGGGFDVDEEAAGFGKEVCVFVYGFEESNVEQDLPEDGL